MSRGSVVSLPSNTARDCHCHLLWFFSSCFCLCLLGGKLSHICWSSEATAGSVFGGLRGTGYHAPSLLHEDSSLSPLICSHLFGSCKGFFFLRFCSCHPPLAWKPSLKPPLCPSLSFIIRVGATPPDRAPPWCGAAESALSPHSPAPLFTQLCTRVARALGLQPGAQEKEGMQGQAAPRLHAPAVPLILPSSNIGNWYFSF